MLIILIKITKAKIKTMKPRFTKFDADQSKLYRKKLALKLKQSFELLDSTE